MKTPTPDPGARPLDGITVVDLSRVLAGPFCTMVLAQQGARVVKVEVPGTGDDARAIGPHAGGQSLYFAGVNHGKESIALDLKAAVDCAIFEDLLADADVLVENFRPGTLARLGFDWETLSARHPRLVYAAVSGFGHTGPLSPRPAYDMVVQGMGGIMSVTGQPGGPPTRVGISIGDIAAGLYLANGIVSALLERTRTGRGCMVDVAMLDCQVALLEEALTVHSVTGEVAGPLGAHHPRIAPFGAFDTADGHVVVAAGNDRLFGRLCSELGREGLVADARFRTGDLRRANLDALRVELERSLRGATTDQWLERLGNAGIPCAPVNDVAAVAAHPQVAARGMLVEIDDPQAGPMRVVGNPIRIAGREQPPPRPAPRLDADRARILERLRRR